ncbi:MAG: hypothetical protein AAFU03_13915 [Bacteroidota bacterium]
MKKYVKPHLILFIFTLAALVVVYLFVTYFSGSEKTDHMAFLFPIIGYAIWMLLFGEEKKEDKCGEKN